MTPFIKIPNRINLADIDISNAEKKYDVIEEETEMVQTTLYRKVAVLKKIYNRTFYGPLPENETEGEHRIKCRRLWEEVLKAESEVKDYFTKR